MCFSSRCFYILLSIIKSSCPILALLMEIIQIKYSVLTKKNHKGENLDSKLFFLREPKIYKIISEYYKPRLTKKASYTIFIYGKMLLIHFSCNSISTENCMKGLWLVFFHIWKLYDQRFSINQKYGIFTFHFSKFFGCDRNRLQMT